MNGNRGLFTEQHPSPSAVILAVDNSPVFLHLVCSFLKDSGYYVLPAQNALEAELVFAQSQGLIDLLLTDLDLGDGMGTDLARSFMSRAPRLKVLVVSGRPSLDEIPSLRNQEFSSLGKPFTKNELMLKIAVLLGRDPDGSSTSATAEEV